MKVPHSFLHFTVTSSEDTEDLAITIPTVGRDILDKILTRRTRIHIIENTETNKYLFRVFLSYVEFLVKILLSWSPAKNYKRSSLRPLEILLVDGHLGIHTKSPGTCRCT